MHPPTQHPPTHSTPRKSRAARLLIAVGLSLGLGLGLSLVLAPAPAASQLTVNGLWKSLRPKTDKRYYTKKQSRTRFAPKPHQVRGTWAWHAPDSKAQVFGVASISFGLTLPEPPIVHYIAFGQQPPSGCTGTAELPAAAPGHLCVWEGVSAHVAVGQAGVTTMDSEVGADVFGAIVYGNSDGAAASWASGSWVLGVPAGAKWR